jgi:hypothetical protein
MSSMGVCVKFGSMGQPVMVNSAGAGRCVTDSFTGSVVFRALSGARVWISACFPLNEQVITGEGETKKIGCISKGDKIRSLDTVNYKPVKNVVTGVHNHIIYETVTINKCLTVSATHPLLVLENNEKGGAVFKWKAAFDLREGDILKTLTRRVAVSNVKIQWNDEGVKVINLSTDSGLPFCIKGVIAKADNDNTGLYWSNSPISQELNRIRLNPEESFY